MKRASRRSNAVTIRTVATHAGVSPMSVSNVLNGRRVTPETQAAVERALAELNYTPNAAARQLASGGVTSVGVLLHPALEQDFLSPMLVGVLNATSKFGVQLVVERASYQNVTEAWEAVRTLAARGAGGALLPPGVCEAMALAPETVATNFSLVAFAPGRELPGMASVRIDDFAAARDMTSMLLDQGHRRIGFITAPRSLGVFESRRGGYLAALHARGVEIDSGLILEGQMDFRSGFSAAARMLESTLPPTAIFASNDDMAAGALVAARSLGLDVPGALAVAGFDDTPLATKLWPPLTTVRFPVIEMAELAIEMLVQAARSHVPPAPVTRYLSYSIIGRASSGSPTGI